MDLLSLDDTRDRLRVLGQSLSGRSRHPGARIIGSLDRNADFDRTFRPRRRLSRGRLTCSCGSISATVPCE